MCGIAGILNLDGRPVDRATLEAMTDALAHRGPDGEGFFLDGAVGLGHRRLSILDLSVAGCQPMASRNGRYHITYNGEIYNFVELRRELTDLGFSFQTSTDTEVLLAAFVCWGPACLKKLNGMWAFAIWDKQARTLFLARDRFGVKPLFICHAPKRFAFASEIKALIPAVEFKLRPNLEVLCDVLSGGIPDRGEETVFRGIARVKAGSWMTIDLSAAATQETWWDTWSNRPDVPRDPRAQVERYRELFDDACRIRLRSDVPVGTLLSGGLDSSSVVCTISARRSNFKWSGASERLASDWQRTFTARYPGLSADEGEYPDLVLKAAGLKGTDILPTVQDARTFFQHLVNQQDVPVDQSLYAVHTVYREVARHGIRVTLDGQGADEVLSGYEAMTAARHYLQSGDLKEALAACECQAALSPAHGGKGQVARKVLAAALRSHLPLLTGVRKLLKRPRPVAEPPSGFPSKALLEARRDDAWEPPEGAGTLDAELYDQVHRRILPGILRKFDHAAMSYSVESRMPFMDWRLITYSFALPAAQKVSGGFTKVVLREAMRGLVPQQVLERRAKLGFPIPAEWLSTPQVSGWLSSIVSANDFADMPYWNAGAVRKWFSERSSGSWSNRDMVDAIAVAGTYLWHKRFFS